MNTKANMVDTNAFVKHMNRKKIYNYFTDHRHLLDCAVPPPNLLHQGSMGSFLSSVLHTHLCPLP